MNLPHHARIKCFQEYLPAKRERRENIRNWSNDIHKNVSLNYLIMLTQYGEIKNSKIQNLQTSDINIGKSFPENG
jgi:hypothetical protein